MSFIKINIENETDIKCDILIDNECKMIISKFEGDYRIGSKGNTDGLFIFSKIVSCYFLYESIAVVLYDLRKLNYTYGNTLLKALNFFEEIGRDNEEKQKKIFIVASKENKSSIEELLKMKINKDYLLLEDYDEAIKKSLSEASKYFL